MSNVFKSLAVVVGWI
jgi:hypothetical protein